MKASQILTTALLSTLLGTASVHAADGTWTGAGTTNDWFNVDNWLGGTAYPGAQTGTTSSDTASFNPGGASLVQSSFDELTLWRVQINGGAGAVELTGNLHLTGRTLGGQSGRIYRATTSSPGAGNYTTTFNGNIVLEGAEAADIYYFALDSRTPVISETISNTGMIVNGSISGGTTSKKLRLELAATFSSTNVVNGIISDGASAGLEIFKNGNGNWLLNSANTYSGGTILNAGALQLGDDRAVGTGALTIKAGILTAEKAITLAHNNALNFDGNFSFQNRSTEDFNLGMGAVTLNADINIRMLGTVGKVVIGGDISASAAGYGINRLTDEGTLELNGTRSYSGVTGVSRGTLVLGGASTGGGATSVGGASSHVGRLHLNHADALGSGELEIKFGGTAMLDNSSAGAIQLNGNRHQIWGANFTFIGTQDLDLGGGTISLGANAGAERTVTVSERVLSVNGVISDGTHVSTPTRSLIKSGSGTLELGGANLYTGTTVVSAGTLLVNGSHQTGGAYSISNGATLGGSGTIATSSLTFSAGSRLAPGGSESIGSLKLALGAGSLILTPLVSGSQTGSLLFTLGSVTSSDRIVLTDLLSTLTIGSGQLDWADFQFDITDDFVGGTFTLFETSQMISGTFGANLSGLIGGLEATLGFSQDGTDLILTVATIPEPGTYSLVIIGAGLFFGRSIRRRTRQV